MIWLGPKSSSEKAAPHPMFEILEKYYGIKTKQMKKGRMQWIDVKGQNKDYIQQLLDALTDRPISMRL